MDTPIMLTYADRIGEEVGVSEWFRIDQSRIDEFSRATDDPDPMHIDPAWCEANSPFHSTIAFGFLTLSMLTSLSRWALGWAHDSTVESGGYAINYGLERVRFVAPVPVNARIRARFVVAESKEVRPGEQLTKFNVTVEIEGQERPALVAEWLGLWVSGEGHTRIQAKQA
jgi:acyl dehydratase